MITFTSLLWAPNHNSLPHSAMYTEEWALKLFAGFARNTTHPHRNVLFVDRKRDLPGSIEQIEMDGVRCYGDCIRPFSLGVPMIMVGLDTIITGNIDKMVEYCLTEKVMALPRDPYGKSRKRAINGVCLVPAGYRHVYEEWRGENDMEHIRRFKYVFIDDKLPGMVRSYKAHVERFGLNGCRICYFHGDRKPHQINNHTVLAHWTV